VISKKQKLRIFRRDKFKCLICKTRKHLTIDHIVPTSKGGDDQDNNLQTLCEYHNRAKGNQNSIDYRDYSGLPSMNPYIGSKTMLRKLLNME
jgi:5-methylcytosine-specific restriction endonuclease McrA